ncbi:MAG TPA: phosphopantetheine-binding protein, partial [Streptomyces sp.]|nr:phosphopantetheine-binding protein [Streptomyces sp.]
GLGRRVRRLSVSHAFHSPRMEGMLEEFRTVLKEVEFGTPRVPVVSTLTGRLAAGEDLRSADYWVRQVREAVRYADAVTAMEEEGVRTYLEIGPGGALAALAAQSVRDADAVVATASVRPGVPEAESVVRAVGLLHARGVTVDWEAFFAGSGARRVSLPTYAFQRRRYWLDQLVPADGDTVRVAAPAAAQAETAPEPEVVPLPERLAELAVAQREQYVLQIVTNLVATVLKHGDPSGIAPDRPFQDLGFDSLTGVELRNRLAKATGLTLPATVVFDHPNPAALAAFVLNAAGPAPDEPSRAVRDGLDRLEASLEALPADADTRAEVEARLRGLLERLSGTVPAAASAPADPAVQELIASASADEIFDFIDTQLGRAAD